MVGDTDYRMQVVNCMYVRVICQVSFGEYCIAVCRPLPGRASMRTTQFCCCGRISRRTATLPAPRKTCLVSLKGIQVCNGLQASRQASRQVGRSEDEECSVLARYAIYLVLLWSASSRLITSQSQLHPRGNRVSE